MKSFFIVLSLLISVAASAAEGHLCISPVESNQNRPGDGRTANYAIQIDNGPRVILSTKKSTMYPTLGTTSKHMVKVYYEGKLDQSFVFNFSSQEMCLWYQSLYYTWLLSEQKGNYSLCNCR